ncbi:telomerase inhibitor/ribosome biogenesis protein PXR1 [Aspergillus lucknowensis]|uniref:Protein PXR1 n=1 Tax=Aspergillus lucknowensis TaxID=176173 RepID=A0ABR4LQI4_9EURO
MGLAAPRKRTKFSHDPNNTTWSRSTSGFGHKILSSQGWTPGSFLGARNAAHADMFTAASASHIRVIVKDDTLGLGARSKRDALDEPTGLDAFKGLLGRLNGKSDAELQADRKKRDDIKLARYAATKWQAVRFVSAGLLAQENADEPSQEAQEDQNPLVDAKRSSPRTSETGDYGKQPIEGSESRGRRDKKSKKSKNDKNDRKDRGDKKDKEKQRKKDRKRKHEKDSDDSSLQEASSSKHGTRASERKSLPAEGREPLVKERRPLGRHVIRGRHIAQKKKSLMDQKSLNEIFMIKS